MKRVTLRAKDAKRLLQGFLEEYSWISGVDAHSRVEVVQLDTLRLFYVNGFPLILETQRRNIPTLNSKDVLKGMPIVVVDMGAVPYVCKGANIMVPGIVRINSDFKEKKLVVIVDEKHNKALALGLSLFSSGEIQKKKKGIVIKNLLLKITKIINLPKFRVRL